MVPAPDVYAILNDLGFSHAGSIDDGEVPVITLNHTGKGEGWVYCWVECVPGQQARALYVGKAGKTLKKRMGEHRQGFKKSATGQTHAATLREIFARQGSVELWCRQSDTESVFGVRVSRAHMEEAAVIQRLAPRRNIEMRLIRPESSEET